ncbi:hypothetical protein LCGC14_3110090, partial [marine sediment metagenome]
MAENPSNGLERTIGVIQATIEDLKIRFEGFGETLSKIESKIGTKIEENFKLGTENSYDLKALKIEGIIKKIGKGVWEVNEEKLKEYSIRNEGMIVKKSSAVAEPDKAHSRVFTMDSVRGHAFQFILKIHKLRNWNRRREYLDKNNIEYKKVGSNWHGERILIDGHKVWLTPISIVVYFPNFKSFMGKTANDTKNYAIYEFKRVISKVEALLRVSFRISNNYKFKVSRQHYALIKNTLAKQYDKKGNKLFCYTEQGLWFIIDNSYNLHEAETVHPDTG